MRSRLTVPPPRTTELTSDAVSRAEVEQLLVRRWNQGMSLDDCCVDALVPTGKLFRPMLMVHSATAVGGDAAAVLPAAAAVELGHVGSLVHDDVIDGDVLRRGRPSIVGRHGVSRAIVVGDALFFGLYNTLCDCVGMGVPADRVVEAVRIVSEAGVGMCRGQTLEEEMTGDVESGLDAYLEMARLKTGLLIRAACEVGAVLAGAEGELVEAVAEYGQLLGLAYQMHDDVTSFQQGGGQDDSDWRNARVTLPIVLAHRGGSAGDKTTLRALFSVAPTPRAVRELDELVRRIGAVREAEAMAEEYAERARASLAVLPPSPSRELLSRLTGLAVSWTS